MPAFNDPKNLLIGQPVQTGPLIQLDHISFTHPGQSSSRPPALRDISLEINQGEYISLVGANGSGKTTLARHLNALLQPDQGRVLVQGRDTRQHADLPIIRSLVGMVFQHPEDQLVATTVEEDVAFGPENLGLAPDEIRRRVDDSLHTAGIWEVRRRPPHLLSGGQIQRVALAGTLAMLPRLIIFDEATAMLDPAGRRAVLELMRRLNNAGLTILSITHFMEDAVHAGRVIVLDGGQIALDGSPEAVFADPQKLESLGLELPPAARLAQALKKYFPSIPDSIYRLKGLLDAIPANSGAPDLTEHRSMVDPILQDSSTLIKVSNLSYVYMPQTPMAHRALNEISLQVRSGELHGLIGATGSGKSTLLQHLNGLLRPQSGQVRVGRFDLNDPNITVREVCQVVGLVFQDPEMQIFEQFVGDEVAYGPRFFLPKPELRERVRWAMNLVGLDFETFKDRRTGSLSGGERRKVALASVLSLKPEILVLDEPTAGLDPVSRRELRGRLLSLKQEGATLVISSHQMEELALLTDRITVLDSGRDVFSGIPGEIFEREAELMDLGLGIPTVTSVARDMAAKGWPLPAQVHRPEQLLQALDQIFQDTAGQSR